ncbi:unnamed protein product [Brassicogethes aeneus]|uniref:Cation-transporting ATPase n=1 Tax=Brassicogethes aeneus TaxID=1431903 RepID=A0A9P0AWV3_BRAAE|nr:unnamed protein product [Brassicogethes aeneus]
MNKNLKKENNNQINREKAANNHEKFMHTKVQYINFGENDQMEIAGYKPHKLKSRVTLFFYFLTFGLLRLFFHWYPQLKLLSTHKKCSLKNAEKVLITDNYKGKFKSYFVKEIIEISTKNLSKENSKDSNDELLNFFLCDGTERSLSSIRILKCKKLTYIWNDERCKFVKLAGLDKGVSRNDLHKYTGYTTKEQNVKRVIYGYNEIVVPVQSICTLLVLEALTPFYIFQVFSLIVWFCEYYYYYTIAIIIMSVFGISTSIIQTRKNQKNLKGTVHSSDKAVVCRGNGLYQDIPTTYLVPGDVIVIPKNGCEMQCDAILLNGSCVVNESMLTGESVPVTKNSLPKNNTPYNVKEDVNHTLYCGTKVIQTRHYDETQVLAVVIRTAYLTTKGELVRSIMYPPPADFKFDQDSYKFIGILGFIASLGFIYTIVSKSSRNIAAVDILIKALDLVTVAVPPALPAAMTVGKLYALNRLKNHKIFCINSRVINVSGSIDCVCFDKTGTLTEDALDMWGVVPVENNKIKPPIKTFKDIENESSLFRGMASCHSLTLIDETTCGDPLDVKMFECTNWVLEEPSSSKNYVHKIRPSMISKPFASSPNNNSYEIGILKHFQFSSTLQRMSVITKSTDAEHFDVFCKGSPEMIISLCDNTTVPNDIQTWLQNYTEQGYRVIALATKKLNNLSEIDLNHLPREDVESNLQFLGLIILENKLKPETHDVIKTLKRAGLKIVMITGMVQVLVWEMVILLFQGITSKLQSMSGKNVG